MDLFHMFSSYLITEILIMKCLYLDPQFQSRWVKKTFGITNKWEVQLNIEGIEKKNQKLTSAGGGDVYLVLKSTRFIYFSIF